VAIYLLRNGAAKRRRDAVLQKQVTAKESEPMPNQLGSGSLLRQSEIGRVAKKCERFECELPFLTKLRHRRRNNFKHVQEMCSRADKLKISVTESASNCAWDDRCMAALDP
jgi:hypothetical protein